ncbi:MAG: FIST N-terminal domain-containing protein, partial [Aquabacterium sp.]
MSSALPRFLHAHATHPHPELALEIAWAQLASQGATTMGASLGWCYLTEAYSDQAEAVLDSLRARLPGVAWVGGVGAGVLASGVEYIDEPALVVMVCNLPADCFRIFHGRQPLPGQAERQLTDAGSWRAHTAQVHADARTADLCELLGELADRTDTGYLFGGLSTG